MSPGGTAGRVLNDVGLVLTTATTALNAVLGEQQRPANVARGVLRRLARA